MTQNHMQAPKEFGYPEAYKGFKPIEEQIRLLQKRCRKKLDMELDIEPALAFVCDELLWKASDSAEGLGAVIRPGIGGSHQQDMALALELLMTLRDGTTPMIEYVDPAAFRQAEHTKEAYEKICAEQTGDILIFPVQFGKRHARRIDSDVVASFGTSNEFGLGFLEVMSLLVTHPERLTGFSDLGISCPGDELDFHHNDHFDRVLVMTMQGGRDSLRSRPFDYKWSTDHGAATGFVSL